MSNNKLSDYLGRMTVYEMNRFRKYLYSPLYNEDLRLRALLDALLPFAKNYCLAEVDEKAVWSRVIGKQKFNRLKYVRLQSDTVKKLEHFLVIDRFQQQPVLQQCYLLEIMNTRRLAKHVPEQMRLAIRKHEQSSQRDATYYYEGYLLQQQQNLFLENREERSTNKNLEGVLQSLDTYYYLNKLKYWAALLHYQNFLTIEAERDSLLQLMHITGKPEFDLPAIQIYRHIILSFTDSSNETHYRKLSQLLAANRSLFGYDELKSMVVFAMNYCINQINYGKSTYLNELLELYKLALHDNLLLNEGQLSQWDYKNIVTVALRVKDLTWADGFIEEYKQQLPKADRANAYTFNRARYHFYTRNYNEVLRLLQDVKYNDIFYQLDSKTTLLKTYYELGEELPMLSLKDSFRVLLQRKRAISPQQRQNYLNLLKLTLRLFKADVGDKQRLNALKKEIEETANVADKSWLLEKVEELSPSN